MKMTYGIFGFLFPILAVFIPLSSGYAQDSAAIQENVKVLTQSQLQSCHHMCFTETQTCLAQPGIAADFCNSRMVGCTTACSACISAFSICMKDGDQTVPFCQTPYSTCLEKKLNASGSR